MKAFTLHKVDDELYKRLVSEASEKGWSVNETAKRKLRDSYGLGSQKKKKDLSWMRGMITKEDWDRAEKRINAAFEAVDKEEWK